MQELNRTFIGIKLPNEAQQKLGEVQMTVRHKAGSDVVRFVNPAEMQIVLMALGELNMMTFENVKNTLPRVVASVRQFQVTIEGLGGTPSNLQPRFIWAGIGGAADQLIALHNAIERTLMPLVPSYQPVPFKPHVDLGRMKTESEANRTALGRAIRMAQVGLIYTLPVVSVEMFRSTATSQGVALVSYASCPLGS